MLSIDRAVPEVRGSHPGSLPEEILKSESPLLFRGLVADWPLVRAGIESAEAADGYIRRFDRNASVGLVFAPPEAGGRIFYNEDMSGFNFEKLKLKLSEVLDRVRQHLGEERPPTLYIGSTTVDTCLPGFRDENDIDLDDIDPLVSIWLGNRTRVAAHFDLPHNLACCAVGRRRFTLFPPEQLKNLYVGPLDFNPAGQAISLVDFNDPDFDRFPRFGAALKEAQVAELGPGDALFVPSMWWHHVEALGEFNVLINYWWSFGPAFAGDPKNVLTHALLSLRGLPGEQRRAWQEIFRHYVFEFDEDVVAHIPERRRGILGDLDDTVARRIRAHLLNRLNR
jgi:hypothetical protein